MPQDRTAPDRRARNALLAAGIASFMLMGAGQALFGPALPTYERLLAITTAQAAWIVSAFWVGSFLGVALMYFIGTKVNPRSGLAGLAVGAVLLALGGTWLPVVAGSVLFGAGYGVLTAVFNPRVLAVFGPRGPSMLSLLNASFSIGAIAAPQVFIALGGDPKLVFGLIAVLAAVLAAVLWLATGLTGRVKAAAAAQSGGFRLSWPILIFGAFAIGMEASLVGLGPTALVRAGLSEESAANLLSLFFVAFLAGRIALVFLAHLVPSFAIYTGAVALAALCSFGVALGSAAWFFPPMGLATGLFFPGFFVTATARMGADARVAPVIIGMGLVGAILSPLIYAQLIGVLGPRGFFWLTGGVAGTLTLAALAMFRSMVRG